MISFGLLELRVKLPELGQTLATFFTVLWLIVLSIHCVLLSLSLLGLEVQFEVLIVNGNALECPYIVSLLLVLLKSKEITYYLYLFYLK